MKIHVLVLSLIVFFSSAAHAHSIVIVHLGPNTPEYLSDTLFQARLFNPSCEIVLLANKEALNKYVDPYDTNITKVAVEDLVKTEEHLQFCSTSVLRREEREAKKATRKSRRYFILKKKKTHKSFFSKKNKLNISKNFWFYACERFFYLDDYMKQYNKTHVIHIETDVMLYADIEDLIPVFKKKYPGIAATFINDDRCIPSIVYISKSSSLNPLIQCFVQHAPVGTWDMEILALLRKSASTDVIDSLPIVMDSYKHRFSLKSAMNHAAEKPQLYSNNISLFKSVFDAAAIGQYLGATIYKPDQPGFINERCIFNPSHFEYKWVQDSLGRKVPFMIFGDEVYRINNLHIHSKRMGPFLSMKPNNLLH